MARKMKSCSCRVPSPIRIGQVCASLVATLVPISDVDVSRSAPVLDTVTVSVTSPTSSSRSMVNVCASMSGTFSRTAVLNPGSDAEIE